MQVVGDLFNTLFLIPIINLLILFYKLLESAGIPGALGFSIIILTVLLRMLIWPLTHAQLHSTQKMTSLKPLMDELKKKHKDDKLALQKAQMDLYKEHGINPAAGCLPTLLQLPILIALYQSILNVFPAGDAAAKGLGWINSILYNSWLHLDKIPNSNFFGLNLAARPSDFASAGAVLLLVPFITAAFTFVQSKMMSPSKVKHYASDSAKETVEKESMEDMMSSMQGQMLFLMPIMIGFFAFQFPVGLAIYWNTLTALGIIQQYLISGWGGMTDLLNRVGIETKEKQLSGPVTKVKIERKSRK